MVPTPGFEIAQTLEAAIIDLTAFFQPFYITQSPKNHPRNCGKRNFWENNHKNLANLLREKCEFLNSHFSHADPWSNLYCIDSFITI